MECDFCGDYHPDGVCWRKKEYNRQKAIESAVEKADRIICDAADGTDELLLLTTLVAKKFTEKVESMAHAAISKKVLFKGWGE